METASDHDESTSPKWVRRLQHACPSCRSSIKLSTEAVVTCSHCGFQARNLAGVMSFVPGMTANEWQDFFEQKASSAEGDTSAANDYRFAVQQRYIMDGFRRLIGDVAPDSCILDVGCGNGIFWQTLFGRRPVVGVDYSPSMCKRAQLRGMLTYCADAMTLPFADNQFDLIYSAEVLQCINNLPALGAELARVCKPGGRIILSTLNRRSLFRRGMRIFRALFPTPAAAHRHSIMRTANEVASLKNATSLIFVRVCWAHFPLPWLHIARTTRYLADPLASNLIIEFTKAAPSARMT